MNVIPMDPGFQRKNRKEDKKSRVTRGYSIYYVLCRCGCGCGHSCEMKYGPYGKSHKSQGIAALQGEEGEKLRALREASAKTRKGHLAKIHGQKTT